MKKINPLMIIKFIRKLKSAKKLMYKRMRFIYKRACLPFKKGVIFP